MAKRTGYKTRKNVERSVRNIAAGNDSNGLGRFYQTLFQKSSEPIRKHFYELMKQQCPAKLDYYVGDWRPPKSRLRTVFTAKDKQRLERVEKENRDLAERVAALEARVNHPASSARAPSFEEGGLPLPRGAGERL